MDLAVRLGIEQLEIRSAYGRNALVLPDERLEQLRVLASERGLKVAALASPLWKWCRSGARPGRVDSFGFPVRVAAGDRPGWVERAVTVAGILRAPVIRVFSHLRAGELTESFIGDPLLLGASAGSEPGWSAAAAGERAVVHGGSCRGAPGCHGPLPRAGTRAVAGRGEPPRLRPGHARGGAVLGPVRGIRARQGLPGG